LATHQIAKNWWQSHQGKQRQSLSWLSFSHIKSPIENFGLPISVQGIGCSQSMQVEMFEAIAGNEHPAILALED